MNYTIVIEDKIQGNWQTDVDGYKISEEFKKEFPELSEKITYFDTIKGIIHDLNCHSIQYDFYDFDNAGNLIRRTQTTKTIEVNKLIK